MGTEVWGIQAIQEKGGTLQLEELVLWARTREVTFAPQWMAESCVGISKLKQA